MMKHMTLNRIAACCGGILKGKQSEGETEITAITTDSRTVTDGCLFAAIPGARVDGHSFAEQVMENGAAAVLAERDLGWTDRPFIQVESTLEALKAIAEFYLVQLNIPVVGVTGSVGKTSTKEMIASVLGQSYRVRKTEGNFNNELGLPLTVFRLTDEDQIAVLEMGISHFGEMHRLAKIARPDTCVITNIGYAHLENLGTRDGILKAKSEIFDFLKADGSIVLNGDDERLRTVSVKGHSPLFYGMSENLDVYATDVKMLGFDGSVCKIHTPKGEFEASVAIPGRFMVYNALAAAAVGLVYGVPLEKIREGIEACRAISGRFRVLHLDRYTVVDDCYNANPASMKASLEVLQTGKGRRVAILGDMGELGTEEASLHREVGEAAGRMEIDAIYCAGPLCEHLSNGAKATDSKGKEIRHFETREALMEALPKLIRTGDTILVKASHFMEFDQVLSLLKEIGGAE
jgi:UDP-N-acetylmuramoyl-tripeptide--D-alanyl-D-alanine ligase